MPSRRDRVDRGKKAMDRTKKRNPLFTLLSNVEFMQETNSGVRLYRIGQAINDAIRDGTPNYADAREVDRLADAVLKVLDDVRFECARIAGLESQYWGSVKDEHPHMADICIGAMGAAANICGALFMGKTEAQVREDIESRDLPVEEQIKAWGWEEAAAEEETHS